MCVYRYRCIYIYNDTDGMEEKKICSKFTYTGIPADWALHGGRPQPEKHQTSLQSPWQISDRYMNVYFYIF